ncbi:MAG TPA: S-methyl-5'-thioadenosine phosphorylase [Dehalococcoidia bacterium]|nr:S-methyl-5'-thioadenosine phosphorylase [Dehalococcoidia bacterium]
MAEALVGIIGGSGFYRMEGLTGVSELRLDTPFGAPSSEIVVGTLEGVPVAFLPRHGPGHRVLPGELPSRANVFAMKTLGVEMIVGVSAVGSLREDIEPLHLVVPDQIIDRTRGRPATFFGEGLVAHIAFADPFCPEVRPALVAAGREAGATAHNGGTYVAIEGPAFSTRAESNLYRTWSADVIGMTALPEAKLAREAEICYAVLACATDYDCWHEDEDDVSAEMIVANLRENVAVSQETLRLFLRRLPADRRCDCRNALAGALVTPFDQVPAETLARLEPLIGRYVTAAEKAV